MNLNAVNRKDNTGAFVGEKKGLQIHRVTVKKSFISVKHYTNVYTSKIKLQPLFKSGKIPHTLIGILILYFKAIVQFFCRTFMAIFGYISLIFMKSYIPTATDRNMLCLYIKFWSL